MLFYPSFISDTASSAGRRRWWRRRCACGLSGYRRIGQEANHNLLLFHTFRSNTISVGALPVVHQVQLPVCLAGGIAGKGAAFACKGKLRIGHEPLLVVRRRQGIRMTCLLVMDQRIEFHRTRLAGVGAIVSLGQAQVSTHPSTNQYPSSGLESFSVTYRPVGRFSGPKSNCQTAFSVEASVSS